MRCALHRMHYKPWCQNLWYRAKLNKLSWNAKENWRENYKSQSSLDTTFYVSSYHMMNKIWEQMLIQSIWIFGWEYLVPNVIHTSRYSHHNINYTNQWKFVFFSHSIWLRTLKHLVIHALILKMSIRELKRWLMAKQHM